ncbi:hypothetical protein [Paenibacillus sp. FSL R10-2734]
MLTEYILLEQLYSGNLHWNDKMPIYADDSTLIIVFSVAGLNNKI